MSYPVMKADSLSRKKIEFTTEKVLKDFCPEALDDLIPLDIETLFEQYLPKRFGVSTGYEDLAFGIHGYTEPNKPRSAVAVQLVDSDDIATIRFGRSTIGHETGHAVLHARQFRLKNLELKFLHDSTHTRPKLFRQEDLKAYENPEWQAWEFCKSLFLPALHIYRAVENNLSIRQIADRVNLNPAFVEVRLKNLSLSKKVRAY